MKYCLIFLLFLLGCKSSIEEKSFLSSDISYTNKFYFISEENSIDRRKSIAIICWNSNSVTLFTQFEIVPFDSSDYLILDRPLKIHNRIDSALYFTNQPLDSLCSHPISVQLKDEFRILNKIKLGLKEINADGRLASFKANCDHMDEAVLFELETTKGEKYSIYDLVLYDGCDYMSNHVLLFKGSQLINHQER